MELRMIWTVANIGFLNYPCLVSSGLRNKSICGSANKANKQFRITNMFGKNNMLSFQRCQPVCSSDAIPVTQPAVSSDSGNQSFQILSIAEVGWLLAQIIFFFVFYPMTSFCHSPLFPLPSSWLCKLCFRDHLEFLAASFVFLLYTFDQDKCNPSMLQRKKIKHTTQKPQLQQYKNKY